MSRQVVMSAKRAAESLALLKPAFAVPIHYAFTGGPVMDRIALKYDGTPTRFAYAASSRASLTKVPRLEPGQKLTI